MTGLSSQIVTYIKALLINNLYVPASLSYLVLLGLAFLSIALIFKGSQTWKFMFAALGAYYGYIFTSFIMHYIPISGEPFYLVMLIGIVLGMVIVTFFIRIGLSAGLAAIVFFILFALYPSQLPIVLVAAVLVFGFVYLLYGRITMYAAGVMGAFLLWFALIALGLTSLEAQLVAGFLYPLGLYVQLMERYRRRRYFHGAGLKY